MLLEGKSARHAFEAYSLLYDRSRLWLFSPGLSVHAGEVPFSKQSILLPLFLPALSYIKVHIQRRAECIDDEIPQQ